MSDRKGFNFYKSYLDVFNEIKTDKEKLEFVQALFNRQFYGIEPKELKGMARFAYISQKHAIDQQVKGFEDKTGAKLASPTEGGLESPSQQVEGEVQEKEEGKEQRRVEPIVLPFDSEIFIQAWNMYKDYRKDEHEFRYKSPISEQMALKKLGEKSNQDERTAILIIEQTIGNGWTGLFILGTNDKKRNSNGGNSPYSQAFLDKIRSKLQPKGGE